MAATQANIGCGADDTRFGVLVLSHPVVDAYAGFVPPLLGLLQVRCNLTSWETASLLSIGPLTSGLCQPFFAWFTDRVDSRLPAALGLAIGAASLSCIGLAQSFPTLVFLFFIGRGRRLTQLALGRE